ncbi:MAG TPA: Gfo/Idh/MocA family oxidoreductase [Candidatus Hydrogenedentes bacterium]|nr:Gfo/Idh/MocA family oxidoreductase [Candidatus Hydrogenedentota bacterium]HPJ98349.1 Gfo/Idh/MocA family oxidoreductase [Candidatus Hydrogenedentota bacterium]
MKQCTARENMSRRTFLASAAALSAASCATAPHIVTSAAAAKTPANERLNLGAIGFGGMGAVNIRNLSGEQFVALCDVDSAYAKPVFEAFPDARRYVDYREMLAAESGLDGVVIATPDHTHAVIAMAAIKAGKHVFCQKPLAHDVYECRMLAQAAAEAGVVTQMGIQGHAGNGTRTVVESIQAGVIGEVREVHAFCSDSYYPWGHAGWSPKDGRVPEEAMSVPETLNWDLWLGPAAARPYHSCYHPMAWRAFQAFGSGWMADRGAHSLDPVKWALNLGHPSRISATSTGTTDEMHPVSAIVTFEFPKRGKMPPVSVTWYTGLHIPRPAGVPVGEQIGDPTGGILFVGSDGMMTCDTYGERPRLLPEARMKKFKAPEPSIPRIEGESIEGDWVRAIRNGTKACADFSYSGPLSEICALGNIAKRFDDTPIEWDNDRMTVTNLDDANQYVRTPYREGWSL